jgi:hypothetical protein
MVLTAFHISQEGASQQLDALGYIEVCALSLLGPVPDLVLHVLVRHLTPRRTDVGIAISRLSHPVLEGKPNANHVRARISYSRTQQLHNMDIITQCSK